MAIRPELHFRLPNSPGSLAAVFHALDSERVRVYAMSVERGGDVRLVVDNPEHARAALETRHMKIALRDVIVTMVAPRSVGALLESVAGAGVNVEYAYMSSNGQESMVTVVLGMDDAMTAAAQAGL